MRHDKSVIQKLAGLSWEMAKVLPRYEGILMLTALMKLTYDFLNPKRSVLNVAILYVTKFTICCMFFRLPHE